MPSKVEELISIPEAIQQFLSDNSGWGYSSKEMAETLNISHSAMRKHLKDLYDNNIIKRKKRPKFNKTFFYYLE